MHESEKWKWSCSVVSSSLRPPGLQPTRLLRPWDFQGKSTGVEALKIWPLSASLISFPDFLLPVPYASIMSPCFQVSLPLSTLFHFPGELLHRAFSLTSQVELAVVIWHPHYICWPYLHVSINSSICIYLFFFLYNPLHQELFVDRVQSYSLHSSALSCTVPCWKITNRHLLH